MAEVVQHIYQFKRGTAQRWMDINPILRQGEPGFEYDTGKLKIGDGFTPWNALSYINEGSIFNGRTRDDFPKIGNVNTLYKASEEVALYQWTEQYGYELLSSGDQLIDELIDDLDQVRKEVFELEEQLKNVIILYGGSASDNIILGGNEE